MACCCEADFSRLGQVSLSNLLPPLARSFEISDAASGVPISGTAWSNQSIQSRGEGKFEEGREEGALRRVGGRMMHSGSMSVRDSADACPIPERRLPAPPFPSKENEFKHHSFLSKGWFCLGLQVHGLGGGGRFHFQGCMLA